MLKHNTSKTDVLPVRLAVMTNIVIYSANNSNILGGYPGEAGARLLRFNTRQYQTHERVAIFISDTLWH